MMALARLVAALAFSGLTAVAASGSPEPFATLGLVRLDSGIRAPAFTLPDLDGRSVGVPASFNEATLLIFWSTS